MANLSEKVHWHSEEINHILQLLNSHAHGLTTEDAGRRLVEFGSNELSIEKAVSPLIVLGEVIDALASSLF